MPTHKELPRWFLDGPPVTGTALPRRQHRRWLLIAMVPLLVAIGYGATAAIDPLKSSAPRRAVGERIPVRGMNTHVRRAHQRGQQVHSTPSRRATPVTPAPPARRPSSPSARLDPAHTARPLAIGTALPGTGASPGLVALTHPGGVTVTSRSPMPVAISFSSRYGATIHPWTTLRVGDHAVQELVTGHTYAYCFSQDSGHGYAATRGCGTLVIHQTLYGARVPDGAAVANALSFIPR